MNNKSDITEIALSFIESEEMREYYRNTLLAGNIPKRLRFDPDRDCRTFIVGSRAAIGEKLEALRKLPPNKGTLDVIRTAEFALSERASEKNHVFLTTLHYACYKDRKDTWEDRKPFLSYESVLKYVHNQTTENCKIYEETLEQIMEKIWYEVEKFAPDENGELQHKITWILNAKGEIIFFEPGEDVEHWLLGSEEDELGDWVAWQEWGDRENLGHAPVPFDFGDIITIDMRPFYVDVRGVVVGIGDNTESGDCIYADSNGFLHYSFLHHNMLWYPAMVSPLYRAKRFAGDLPDNEHMLKIISEAIKKEPSIDTIHEDTGLWREHPIAEQFVDFLNGKNSKRGTCSWDEFRERFGL